MASDSLAHHRLTVLKDASKDSLGYLTQFGCIVLTQLQQNEDAVVVYGGSTVVLCGFVLLGFVDVYW